MNKYIYKCIWILDLLKFFCVVFVNVREERAAFHLTKKNWTEKIQHWSKPLLVELALSLMISTPQCLMARCECHSVHSRLVFLADEARNLISKPAKQSCLKVILLLVTQHSLKLTKHWGSKSLKFYIFYNLDFSALVFQ